MKTTIIGIILFVFSVQGLFAQTVTENFSDAEKEIIRLSKDKWQWMADKDVDKLSALFHEKYVLKSIPSVGSRFPGF